ncbi:MAG: DMT family transporter [Pseudomonadota bacterium]
MTHFLDGTDRDRPGFAAGLMLSALGILAFQDALVRLAGSEVSFWQFQMIRASSNLVLLCATAMVVWRTLPPWPRRPWPVMLRSLMMILATVFFFGAIPAVTTVEMAAGLYTYPIFVTILSAAVLGEPVGWRRIAAVLIGACGAALILQPFRADFEPVKLMPIGAGFCYAINVILTRRWCRGESPVTLAAAVAISFIIIGSAGCLFLTLYPASEAARASIPYLAYGWREMALWVLAVTLICSVMNATANVLLTKSYQSAEASWLAPFDYTYLIFASIAGLALFGEMPGPPQVFGMVLIASAGVFTAWRERLVSRRGDAQISPS